MTMNRILSTVRHLYPVPGTGDPGDVSRTPAPPAQPLLGGIELLTDGVRAALIDGAGHLVRSSHASFAATRSASADDLVAAVVDTARACFTGHRIRGVGIASAGLIDEVDGVIRTIDELPALSGCPIASLVSDAVGVPAFADHHARLQVLGDRWFGLGLGRSSFASVSTGDTLGVGLLYEGHVIAPHGGRSGAHITVVAGGELCTCGNRGCWKTVATSGWLRARAQGEGLGPVEGIAELVATAAEDQRAADLVEAYAQNLALGLSTIQHLVAPGLYIIHGDAARGGAEFLERIESTLRAVSSWTAQAELPRVVVDPAAADHVALLGGAGLVLSRTAG